MSARNAPAAGGRNAARSRPSLLKLSGERLWRFLFGAGAIVLALVVFQITRTIPVGFSYDSAGPRLLPYIVAAGLALSGIAAMIEAVLQPPVKAQDEQHYDMLPVAIILAAVFIESLLIRQLGWVPVATGLFMVGAFAMGSRRILRDAFAGLVFSVVTLALFNYVLGLKLPLGVLGTAFGLAG